MPMRSSAPADDGYDIYPSFALGSGHIQGGYASLAHAIAGARHVIIDGYPGVLWDALREHLDAEFDKLGVRTCWLDVNAARKPAAELDEMLAPYLGDNDPIFGFRYPGTLRDFFDAAALGALCAEASNAADMTILFGCGAALAGWEGPLVYVDVPKNEIQFRQRAGAVTCFGVEVALPPKPAYKRSYFVDWPAANRHKCALYYEIDWVVDGQRADDITFTSGDALRRGLDALAGNFFRVRPWFEPGPWGGQWIRQHMPQLAQEVPNYAWSFELIVPENGLVFESDGWLLEVSFDFLMYRNPADIIGEAADDFGYEFPIRFDLLDTISGGNLSVQCHPRPDYIRTHFGETYTQDETYYILEAKAGARCFLGFQEGVDPAAFRSALEASFLHAQPVEIDSFVQSHAVARHDLLLIPNGTVHCSGDNTLVLEISATPYIFTFKMYDWMRLDLDGKPRPLNIARAFENLYFDRQGARMVSEFIAQPQVVAEGPGWQRVHLPTHRNHFYDVERLEFTTGVDVMTEGSCQIMSLVEGDVVLLETANGMQRRFHFAETFVVPAAAGSYRLVSENGALVKVIKSFIKPRAQWVTGIVGNVPDGPGRSSGA